MEENNNEKKDFIKEKIVKKTGAGKGFRNFIKILVGAILFGVIAAGVFVVSRPTAEKLLGTEAESTTAEVVTIPRDENLETPGETVTESESETEPESAETDEETEPETEQERPKEEPSTEDIENIVTEVMDKYEYSMDDLNGLWKNLSVLCNDLDSSIVTITSEKEEELFGNHDNSDKEYSGIAIAETFNETMILTLSDAAEEEGISVICSNGNSQPGYIKHIDKMSGLAVISIKKSEMTDTVKALIRPIELGNSYAVTRGDLLIAMGSPRGRIHSTDYAWASYIDKNALTVDGSSRIIYISDYLDNDKGTWLLNVKGELVGWNDKFHEGNVVTGISDFKSLIERMSNSSDYAYLGITPSTIPAELENDSSLNVPKGVYVMDVENEGPAYMAGILPGDILTSVDDMEIRNMTEYSGCMEELNEGDEITVAVAREARGEYRRLEYTVVVGKRN
ncbi:MAG: S1C family serine protease [Lachnospiraceae bacterium]|nr:S1C family serine protease [Lachnospiraceae bacterium]